MDKRQFVLSSGLSCAFALSGCDQLSGETYRYRATVEVDTPQGIRSGSSVIQMLTKKGIAFPSPEAGNVQEAVRGEAVAVDLPDGPALFVLLDKATFLVDAVHPSDVPTSDNPVKHAGDLKKVKGTLIVRRWGPIIPPGTKPRENYPRFVRFRDIREPKSVELVDPDNLAAGFGERTKLRSITVTITNDPVAAVIERGLLWLPSCYRKILGGSEIYNSNAIQNSLSLDAFSTEIRT